MNMTEQRWQEIQADFRAWSGGFPPESKYQVTVYIDYAGPQDIDENELRRALYDWMVSDDEELFNPFDRPSGPD
jgi:hypothetical protein